MARPSNTGHRRQEIVNGLMQAMADKGYEKASIQSIAKAAGLSPGLIHYHFKTKQEILIALIHQISEQAAQRFTLLADAAGNAQQQLDAYIDAALALGDGSNPEAVTAWVVIGAEAVRIEEVRAVSADYPPAQPAAQRITTASGGREWRNPQPVTNGRYQRLCDRQYRGQLSAGHHSPGSESGLCRAVTEAGAGGHASLGNISAKKRTKRCAPIKISLSTCITETHMQAYCSNTQIHRFI